MRFLITIGWAFLLTSCANIVAPTGGEKDIAPPQLQNITTINVEENIRPKTIVFNFDEYILLNNWEKYFYISPPINGNVKKQIKGRSLILTIDTPLKENIPYHIGLNYCIKDNNEGNILDSLSYTSSLSNNFDTLHLNGNVKDAYSLKPLENTWVMLFNENINDSLIFKELPNYTAKTNKNGFFHFPNLNDSNYKIVAITGSDFIYAEDEKIAFSNNIITAKNDSFISLFCFTPTIKNDSVKNDSSKIELQNINNDHLIADSLNNDGLATGKLKIISNKNSPCIFHLLQKEKIVASISFNEQPYLIENIIPGKYQLKYVIDNNQDKIWSSGNWKNRILPEKIIYYPSEITIRSNWDLELEWIIEE